MISSFRDRQFAIFLLTGGVAALVNFGSRMLYSLAMPFSPAIILAYLTGMVTAFVLAKIFVFKDSAQSTGQSFFRFTVVNVAAVAQTWAVSMVLVKSLPLWGVEQFVPEIAHGVGVIVPVFTSFLGHKYWSFR